MGTGFERIRRICEKENAPFPEIEFNGNYFYVIFRQSHEYLKLANSETKEKNVSENVPEKRWNNIISIMKKDRQVTIAELAKHLSVTEKTIKRDIEKLRKAGKLERVGPDKGGYWEVLR